MLVLYDNFNKKLNFKTVIALGSFDGLHAGHLSLMEKAVEVAKLYNAKSMVNTFTNHPLITIDKNKAPKLIMDNETKTEILEDLNIEIVNYEEFDKKLMMMTAEEFIYNTIKYYNAAAFVVGFNHKFGYKNLGDINLLKDLSKKLNFKLYIMEPIKYLDGVISSTRIRNSISEGNIDEANKMLLRPFSLKGIVVMGKQIGRTFGFPTANLKYDKQFILPKNGVYYTIAEVGNKLYRGITNVGSNPTISSDNPTTIETNILDFNKDIYGQNIKIHFITRIRDEKRFDSIEELKNELTLNRNFAKNMSLEIL